MDVLPSIFDDVDEAADEAALLAAEAEADAGLLVPHEEVAAWVASWGTDHELGHADATLSRHVVWTLGSQHQLAMIRAYIEQFNPAAAGHLFDALLAAGNSLVAYAERGRPIPRNRRELVAVWPYLIT